MPRSNACREAVANDTDEPNVSDEATEDDKNPDAERERHSEKPEKPDAERFQAGSAIVTMVITIIQTSVIAWFGFTLSGRLELAIKERKATVDGAKAMGDLIVDLRKEQTVEADRSLMLQLAMYGEDAIGPMVIMAMTPGNYGPDIPIFGLQRLAITHRDSTCKALVAGQASDAWIQDSVRRPLLDKLLKEMKC